MFWRMSKEPSQSNHPLILHYLTRIRDKNTPAHEFRNSVHRLATLLAMEVLGDLSVEDIPVESPMETTAGHRLNQRIGLVPIMRAGLGLVEPILQLIPEAEVWHLGLYRDEQTLEPVEYYQKLPPGQAVDIAIVLDPMLATGGSAIAALEALTRWGVKKTKFMGILAAPEGIGAVRKAFPETDLHVCRIDSHLNDIGYIVPGLGDAGDRIFNAAAE